MAILPTNKTVKVTDDPKNLIMFGLPKVGKTTSLAQLPDCLIVDLEMGTKYIDGYTVQVDDIYNLLKVAKALDPTEETYEEHHFKFIVIDTVTALEDMVLPYAKYLYQQTQMGKNYDGDDVRTLPQGSGYLYVREAVKKVIDKFKRSGANLILTGHVKDKSLTEGGTDLNVKQLDLNGKLANILSADSDGICYVYRDVETGNLQANFGDMNSVLTGSRVPHLAGKTIELAERQFNKTTGDWEVITHWDRIYPSIAAKKEGK